MRIKSTLSKHQLCWFPKYLNLKVILAKKEHDLKNKDLMYERGLFKHDVLV